MNTEAGAQETAKEPFITIGAIFAFYVVDEGLLRAYEWFAGHHLEITDNSTWLKMIGIGVNLVFGGHFLYSAWESRKLTGFVVGVTLVLGTVIGSYLWVTSLPEQGRQWIETVQQMPDGTIFPDPYDHGRLKRKQGLGIMPVDGPFDVGRPEPCLTPNNPIGCQP